MYERILGRIEKSHPHHSTTHSDAPCACKASLLTVLMCTCFSYLYSEIQSYFCSFKYLTSAWMTPLLKSAVYLFSVLLSFTCTACLVCVFLNDCIYYSGCWNWFLVSVLLLVNDTRNIKQFEQVCYKTIPPIISLMHLISSSLNRFFNELTECNYLVFTLSHTDVG